MARLDVNLPDQEVLDFAFEQLSALATLLNGSGHSELAALFNGAWDMHVLSLRRNNRDGAASQATSEDILDYVFDQLGQTADILERRGLEERAVLFRALGAMQTARRRADGRPAEDSAPLHA